MPYLVDGSNLAHVLGLAREGLADREACFLTVSEFCRERGAQATIIFDGPPPPGSAPVRKSHRVQVVFSEARSADEVLLGFLRAAKSKQDFIVVTSDKSLGDKARHQGAAIEKAHEFGRRLSRKASRGDQASDKPSRPESRAEVEAWLAIFKRGRA